MTTRRAARSAQPRAERRRSLRLRALIDEFRANITSNQRELEFQFQRIAQLEAELDRLKQRWEEV